MELLITDRLHKGCMITGKSPRLISMRKLSAKEIAFARKNMISRYYLPSLNEYESTEFFKEFDKFWDQVIKPFGPDHPFWRNVVSSKMQEWEKSCAYLALILFTLAQKAAKEPLRIIFVCSSIEEEDVCEEWGEKMGWKVFRKPYLSLPSGVRRIFQEIGNLKYFLYMTSICLYKKWFSPKNTSDELLSNKQILINSLFYLNSFKDGKYTDPFFGNLHNIIKEKGYPVTYICKPLGNFKESVIKLRECREVRILIPYSLISWSKLIYLALKILLRRFEIHQSFFEGCDFSVLIKWNARRFASFFSFDSEISYAAIRKLCEKNNIYRLLQLYEGNVFERGSIQGFKQKCSGTTVGYSHAVIYPLNLKMRLTDYEKLMRPEPDIFVCNGIESKRLLKQIGNRETALIHSGCSLRYIPVANDEGAQRNNNLNILAALDGVWSSVTVLDWLLEQAEGFKKYNIKIRAHPNVPLNILLDQCINKLPLNFYQSKDSLKLDIENSFCVVYRQTSVGMQALLNGVPAIYLDIDAPLNADPLMDLKECKWIVRTPGELFDAIHEIRSLTADEKREAISNAIKYLKDYFVLPNSQNVEQFYADNDENKKG